MENPQKCGKCGSSDIEQDTDVLDTWFSSALWPFATLGWPDQTGDLAFFYPTSVLSTARDIIYLWVARMIMTGLKFRNDIPYHTVIIHPTVMTIEGKRMSKSLGTGVDPLDLIKKYGTDGTRFGLTIQAQSQDMRFSEDKLEMSRNFANKIWNASRFLLMNLEGYQKLDDLKYCLADGWILSLLNKTIDEVNKALDHFDFGKASRLLYDFFWSEFCDWYVELCKPRLYQTDSDDKADTDQALQKQIVQNVLVEVLDSFLRLLHPFMPFITEEIWQKLPVDRESIMVSEWPRTNKKLFNKGAESKMDLLKKIIINLRTIKSELNIAPSKKINAVIKVPNKDELNIVETHKDYILNLAGVVELSLGADVSRPDQSALAVKDEIEIYVPLEGLVDVEKERERLKKEIKSVYENMEKVKTKLSKKEFLDKAPKAIVDKEKEKLVTFAKEEERLRKQLEQIG